MIKKCSRCGFETNEGEKHFHKCSRLKDGFKQYCRECCKKIRYIYQNTEHGFMMNMYNTIKKKTNAARYTNIYLKRKKIDLDVMLHGKNLWNFGKIIRKYVVIIVI
jgi:hypothetical protein